MARKVVRYPVEQEGRDQGKVFILTEMPASQGEMWAFRAISALARSGVELPDDFKSMGMGAIAALGFQALAGLSVVDAKPLLDEMMDCVQIAPDQRNPQVVRPLVEDDVEEITTRLLLRKAVFELHTSFFSAAAWSKWTSETGSAAS